jgi:hypothetical protein
MGYLLDVGRNGLLGFAIVGTVLRMLVSIESAYPSLRMINSMAILVINELVVCVKTPVILTVLSALNVRMP